MCYNVLHPNCFEICFNLAAQHSGKNSTDGFLKEIRRLHTGVVTSLWVASATTVSRSRERLKKLPWVPPETLMVVSYSGDEDGPALIISFLAFDLFRPPMVEG